MTMRGPQNPSDQRKMNMLARLIEEHGAAQTSKLFARVLKERAKSDPMARTIAEHVLAGVIRAEADVQLDA